MINDAALKYLQDHLHQHELLKSEDLELPSDLVAVPADAKLVSLEEFQWQPNAIKQSARLFSCASFCEYLNRFKSDESTVYLNVDQAEFTAVLDHHGAEQPEWGRHRAKFAPKQSLEWKAWRGIHKTSLTQLDFAQFIEERIDDIREPEPNTVLQAALDFQSNEKLALGSHQNLDDGSVKFTFTKDNASKNVVFPHRIKIAIPLHENEALETLECRVRYRVDGNGALAFTFSFVKNPDSLIRTALLALADTIRTETEDLHHYEGSL